MFLFFGPFFIDFSNGNGVGDVDEDEDERRRKYITHLFPPIQSELEFLHIFFDDKVIAILFVYVLTKTLFGFLAVFFIYIYIYLLFNNF